MVIRRPAGVAVEDMEEIDVGEGRNAYTGHTVDVKIHKSQIYSNMTKAIVKVEEVDMGESIYDGRN